MRPDGAGKAMLRYCYGPDVRIAGPVRFKKQSVSVRAPLRIHVKALLRQLRQAGSIRIGHPQRGAVGLVP